MKTYYVTDTPEFGRGVYANKPLFKGDTVMVCELLVLSSHDTQVINKLTDLKHYTFKFTDENDCLVLGDGEIFNHAPTSSNIGYSIIDVVVANVAYHLEDFFGRKRMVFVVTKDVSEQGQLFIDYGADTNVDTQSYIDAKSLIG